MLKKCDVQMNVWMNSHKLLCIWGAFQKFPECDQYILYRCNKSIEMMCHRLLASVSYLMWSLLRLVHFSQSQCWTCLCSTSIMMLCQPCWWHLQIHVGVYEVAVSPRQTKSNCLSWWDEKITDTLPLQFCTRWKRPCLIHQSRCHT